MPQILMIESAFFCHLVVGGLLVSPSVFVVSCVVGHAFNVGVAQHGPKKKPGAGPAILELA